jgi:hypothetical protein
VSVDRRREQLVRLLDRRRRRARLLLVCLATALVCGVAAVSVAPTRLLIGGVSQAAGLAAAPVRPPEAARSAGVAASPLSLSDRLRVDPRETQANAIRWASMAEGERRALVNRYWRLAAIDPSDQDRIFQQYEAFRELPEGRQEFLRTRAQRLRDFIQSLSPQDQALLESMTDRQRAERLLELWQARHNTR